MLSCEQGICGSCITDVIDGIPEHRDCVLTAEEKPAIVRLPCAVRGRKRRFWFSTCEESDDAFPPHMPLAGVSNARLPAWALPADWPTQHNGTPLSADLTFADGRIATISPSGQPNHGLWDLGGALALPGLVEPTPIWIRPIPLNAAVRRNPVCWPPFAPCMRIAGTGPRRISSAARPPRWRGRRPMASRICAPILTGSPPTRLTPGGRSPAWRIPASAWSGWRWCRWDCLPTRPPRRPLRRRWPTAARAVYSAGLSLLQLGSRGHGKPAAQRGRWRLDLDLHIDEELNDHPRGLAGGVPLPPCFSGHICCSHGCALASGSEEQAEKILRQLAAHSVTLIALPMTNLLLQDAVTGRTPRQRGSRCFRRPALPALPPCSAATMCRTLSARRGAMTRWIPGLRPVQRQLSDVFDRQSRLICDRAALTLRRRRLRLSPSATRPRW